MKGERYRNRNRRGREKSASEWKVGMRRMGFLLSVSFTQDSRPSARGTFLFLSAEKHHGRSWAHSSGDVTSPLLPPRGPF